jgi:putative copper export protein
LDAVPALQAGSALLFNLALAWLLAALTACRSLAPAGRSSDGTVQRHGAAGAFNALRQSLAPVALLGVVADACALWGAAAAMADVPLAEAAEACVMLLSHSSYGHIGASGCIGLLLFAGLYLRRAGQGAPWRDRVAFALLAAVALARAANSHAAEHGVFSVGVLVEWLHLLLVCWWVGAVAVAGWLVLPRAAGQAGTTPLRYMEALSTAATYALAGIAASGVYNGWRVFGAWEKIGVGGYETTLAAKLLLVALAVLAGGYNKFAGFAAARAGCTGGMTRAVALLRLESVALAGAMLAAVLLASMPPPASM